MDVVSAFIDDRCELKGCVQASILYADYTQWAEENNEYRMSNTKFSTEIGKRFKKVKGSHCNYYDGISLISD